MENDFITVTAVDKHSSDTTSRTFSTTFQGEENEVMLKNMITLWEKEVVPYRRYELITQEDLDDYSEEIREVLDELEISN